MAYETHYVPGDHNVECDICGFFIKRSQARKTHNGLIVCPQDFDPKHPSLEKQAVLRDGQPIKDSRPQTTTTFLGVNENQSPDRQYTTD